MKTNDAKNDPRIDELEATIRELSSELNAARADLDDALVERDKARQIAETLQRDYNAAAWEAAAWDAERRWQMRRLAGERDEARRTVKVVSRERDYLTVTLAERVTRALAELQERAEAHDRGMGEIDAAIESVSSTRADFGVWVDHPGNPYGEIWLSDRLAALWETV